MKITPLGAQGNGTCWKAGLSVGGTRRPAAPVKRPNKSSQAGCTCEQTVHLINKAVPSATASVLTTHSALSSTWHSGLPASHLRAIWLLR